ncbi:MAG: hypothetical protein CMI66_07370 [Pedosphaera sp.]|nr:hypothetical protein [Pedosphaera sp.]HCP36762.1 hypothetical protein [Verrucomicrobiales bacterium]HCZ03138.1 hypothetical protein [Verrucomicrobiales bacterium]|tara:strand:+ start:270 stop:620 length:351 start_codon:yes stop_codon:yes gene_type:complete
MTSFQLSLRELGVYLLLSENQLSCRLQILELHVTSGKDPSGFNVKLNTPPCVPGSDIVQFPESSVGFDNFNSGFAFVAGAKLTNPPPPNSNKAAGSINGIEDFIRCMLGNENDVRC